VAGGGNAERAFLEKMGRRREEREWDETRGRTENCYSYAKCARESRLPQNGAARRGVLHSLFYP